MVDLLENGDLAVDALQWVDRFVAVVVGGVAAGARATSAAPDARPARAHTPHARPTPSPRRWRALYGCTQAVQLNEHEQLTFGS